jgi:hypothetical protein
MGTVATTLLAVGTLIALAVLLPLALVIGGVMGFLFASGI